MQAFCFEEFIDDLKKGLTVPSQHFSFPFTISSRTDHSTKRYHSTETLLSLSQLSFRHTLEFYHEPRRGKKLALHQHTHTWSSVSIISTPSTRNATIRTWRKRTSRTVDDQGHSMTLLLMSQSLLPHELQQYRKQGNRPRHPNSHHLLGICQWRCWARPTLGDRDGIDDVVVVWSTSLAWWHPSETIKGGRRTRRVPDDVI